MHVNYMTRTFTKKVFNMAEKTASMVFSSVKDPLMGGCLKQHSYVLFITCHTNHAHTHAHTKNLHAVTC